MHLLFNFNNIYDYLTELTRKNMTFRIVYLDNIEIYTSDPAIVEYFLKTNFANYGKVINFSLHSVYFWSNPDSFLWFGKEQLFCLGTCRKILGYDLTDLNCVVVIRCKSYERSEKLSSKKKK